MHMYIRLNVRLSNVLYDGVLMKATLVAMIMSILLEIQDKIVFVNKCRDHLHFLI